MEGSINHSVNKFINTTSPFFSLPTFSGCPQGEGGDAGEERAGAKEGGAEEAAETTPG